MVTSLRGLDPPCCVEVASLCLAISSLCYVARPDFLYSLVYDNFFQRSNVGGRNKNKNKMSQNKYIT